MTNGRLGTVRSSSLRLAVLVVIALLGAAIAVERSRTDCFPATMSQYVNTPVRPALTVGFGAIGLCLILVRQPDIAGQRVMSAIGALAIVLAATPARARDEGCTSIPIPELATINTTGAQTACALLMGAVLVGVVLAEGEERGMLARRSAAVGVVCLAPSVLVTSVVRSAYPGRSEEWITQVHNAAALALFLLLLAAVRHSAQAATGLYRAGYRACGTALMLLYVATVVASFTADQLLAGGWRHPVLVAEFIGFTIVCVFWSIQTAEVEGSRPANRDRRVRPSLQCRT